MNKEFSYVMHSDAEAVSLALGEYLNLNSFLELSGIKEAQRYSLLAGGKRIRPILCLAFCRLFGGRTEAAMPYALALEMVHTASLIHDDLPAIDNDDLRRGIPTSHKKFGEATAILAADGLFMDAFSLIARNEHVTPDLTREAIELFAEAVGTRGLVGGEYIDVISEGECISLDALKKMHSMKTGALIRVAAQLGVIAAGLSPDSPEMKNARKYAENIGLAFQIIDDVLDVTGTVEELGKAVRSDEREEKCTFLSHLTPAEALDYAERLTDEAVSAISEYDGRAFLEELARFLCKRRT